MSFLKTLFENLSGFITGEALLGITDTIQDKVEQTTKRVIKAVMLWVLFIIGLLFIFIGAAHYLQASLGWISGMGFIVVGGAIVVFGLLVNAFK